MIRLHPERLAQNAARIRAQMAAARARGPFAAPHVELIAVTKNVPPAVLDLLPAANLHAIGENRVDQAQARRSDASSDLLWHGIGHLQRNKAADAVRVFDVFHALDSLRLARRLNELATNRPLPVYLQINGSREPQKSGFAPEEALRALDDILSLANLTVIGFMTMAQAGAAERDLRQTFRTLRDVRDQAASAGLGNPPPPGLSMGMSNDFEIAIEEGATSIRVGRALFDGVWMDGPKQGAMSDGDRPLPGPGTTGGAHA